MSDIHAALYEININISRLKSNLVGLEYHPDWDAEKVIAARQVLEIVEKLIDMAHDAGVKR